VYHRELVRAYFSMSVKSECIKRCFAAGSDVNWTLAGAVDAGFTLEGQRTFIKNLAKNNWLNLQIILIAVMQRIN
jgi:hypothetical protein